jgi:S-formylglutathione hydrolase
MDDSNGPAVKIDTLSEHACHGGLQGFYRADSEACGGPMRFAVFQPPQAREGRVPVLYFLAGLTCTEETATIKAGAQRFAAQFGLMLVMPDTSPRDTGLPGATGDWECGEGAGFYLDATQAPWASRFALETHVVHELPAWIEAGFPADPARRGVCGHSMGGHGALTLALRHPQRYRSVSAFAPIAAPTQVPWGIKAFTAYLGEESPSWRRHDACALLDDGARFEGEWLVDQGDADRFLEAQLQPQRLRTACAAAGQPLRLRMQPGYDHGYYFVQSFIGDHLQHHAQALA